MRSMTSRFVLGVFLMACCAMPAKAQVDAAKKLADLLKEYDIASKKFQAVLQKTSPGDVSRVYREENPQPMVALRFLELARTHPKTPEAYASLVWIAENSELLPAAVKPYSEAMTLLAEQYADHKDNEKLLERLSQSPFAASAGFLQAVFDKHPSGIVRGRAGFSLALHLKNYCFTSEQLRLQPAWAKNIENFVGPDLFKQMRDIDSATLLKQAEVALTRVQKDHALVSYKRTVLGKAADSELFELRNLMVGKTAPDIEGEGIDGKKIKLSEHRGKVVVLVFWGTWCPHCMAMIPQEIALVKRFQSEPFVMLGVNSDTEREKLQPTLAKRGITWPSFWDGGSAFGPIATRWNVQGWPAVYVIDAQGVIRYKHVYEEKLDVAVATLMKEMRK